MAERGSKTGLFHDTFSMPLKCAKHARRRMHNGMSKRGGFGTPFMKGYAWFIRIYTYISCTGGQKGVSKPCLFDMPLDIPSSACQGMHGFGPLFDPLLSSYAGKTRIYACIPCTGGQKGVSKPCHYGCITMRMHDACVCTCHDYA
jgi:hypothetical protein